MRFKWYGTATLLLESGNTRLLIDPYLKEYSPVAPVPLAEARTADAIFITHPHLDHFQDVDAFSEGVRPVYVSATGISHAKKNGLNAACIEGSVIRRGQICCSFPIRAGRAWIGRCFPFWTPSSLRRSRSITLTTPFRPLPTASTQSDLSRQSKKRLPEASAFVPEENVWYDV